MKVIALVECMEIDWGNMYVTNSSFLVMGKTFKWLANQNVFECNFSVTCNLIGCQHKTNLN